MSAIDLSTHYLGIPLTSPFMTGASPLASQLDAVRRMEDAGCSALVLHSLFEEQISGGESGDEAHGESPDQYLEHIRRLKASLGIPVIGSLNGTTPESWLRFARSIQDAGADALELNIYEVVTDPATDAITIERSIRQIVDDLKHELRIPIAVKLSPFFTAFANLARQLERTGASGLVLFNRFLQPDIDVQHLAAWPRLDLSSSAELLLRLRWVAILRRHLRCSLAVTGGVATPEDGIKAILAGADAVQLVSAILRHGPGYFATMRDGLRRWMESLEFARLDDFRGRLSLTGTEAPDAFERAQYIRTLSGWSSWLEYQSRVSIDEEEEAKMPS